MWFILINICSKTNTYPRNWFGLQDLIFEFVKGVKGEKHSVINFKEFSAKMLKSKEILSCQSFIVKNNILIYLILDFDPFLSSIFSFPVVSSIIFKY